MRRPLQAISATLLATLAVAAPAGASDHLMKINEILPGGSGGAQFVELLDPLVEPFTAPPYKLIVYSSSGAVVGKVALPQADLVAAGTSPYVLANPAQGGTPDALLPVALPTTSGQVCYTRGDAETKIHCVSYGCPAIAPFPSEAGSKSALSFGAGESLQRQPGGNFGPGAPTPDAANSSFPPEPCGAEAVPGPGGGGPDNTRPVVTLGGKKRQRLSTLAVTVTVNEKGTMLARGLVKIGKRKLALRKVKRAVSAGKKIKVRLRLSRNGATAVRAALRQGRRVTASVRVAATDASGNAGGERRRIRVIA